MAKNSQMPYNQRFIKMTDFLRNNNPELDLTKIGERIGLTKQKVSDLRHGSTRAKQQHLDTLKDAFKAELAEFNEDEGRTVEERLEALEKAVVNIVDFEDLRKQVRMLAEWQSKNK